MMLPRTPSQTVGPFFAVALPRPDDPYVVAEAAPGAIRISGHVVDGAGQAVPDAVVETWQASPHADGFRGFGRCGTDAAGAWSIVTLKPTRVGEQAPHVDVSVFARGLLQRGVTRIYFADEEEANAADPVLASLPADARATLIAERTDGGYRFDVRLQGERETVFFAL